MFCRFILISFWSRLVPFRFALQWCGNRMGNVHSHKVILKTKTKKSFSIVALNGIVSIESHFLWHSRSGSAKGKPSRTISIVTRPLRCEEKWIQIEVNKWIISAANRKSSSRSGNSTFLLFFFFGSVCVCWCVSAIHLIVTSFRSKKPSLAVAKALSPSPRQSATGGCRRSPPFAAVRSATTVKPKSEGNEPKREGESRNQNV